LYNLLAIGPPVVGLALRTLAKQDLTNPTLAVIGAHRVGDDGEEPGMQGTIFLVLTGCLMNLDEYVLKEVVPIGVLHAAPNEIGINRGTIPCQEPGESFWIAFAVSQEEMALLHS
jgi:hypothetical protein